MARTDCSKCGAPLSSVHRNYCKACWNAYQRQWEREHPGSRRSFRRANNLKRYDLTPEQFDTKRAEQGNTCPICGVKFAGVARENDAPSIDHDHQTGETRDLLCRLCNSLLGFAQDDPDRLVAAAAYLVRWQTKKEQREIGAQGTDSTRGGQ